MECQRREILEALSRSEIGVETARDQLGMRDASWSEIVDLLALHDLTYPHPAARNPNYLEEIRRVQAIIQGTPRSA